MRWQDTMLTHKEAKQALVKAGLSLDPADWTAEDFNKVEQVLSAAKIAKLSKQGA